MKIFKLIKNRFMLLLFIFTLYLFYIYHLSYNNKTSRNVLANDGIFVSSSISFGNETFHINTNKDMNYLFNFYEKLQFGASKAIVLENICIQSNTARRQDIVIYNAKKDQLLNFNGHKILMKQHVTNGDNQTYHRNVNMFFVKGPPYQHFLVNMHHFFKDLTVDLFSVLRRLSNAHTAENW